MKKHLFFLKKLDILMLVMYLSVFVIFIALQDSTTAASLVVHSSGVEYNYDLSQARQVEFEGPIGRTVIEIDESGQARFIYSDCTDQICIRSGTLKRGRDWAACLPNRIIAQMNAGIVDSTDAGTY